MFLYVNPPQRALLQGKPTLKTNRIALHVVAFVAAFLGFSGSLMAVVSILGILVRALPSLALLVLAVAAYAKATGREVRPTLMAVFTKVRSVLVRKPV